MSLVLRNKGKGMQRSSEQPLVGEERYVTTLITAAKETSVFNNMCHCTQHSLLINERVSLESNLSFLEQYSNNKIGPRIQ